MRNTRIVLTLGLTLTALHGAEADTIKFMDGRKATAKVQVTNETLEKVEYKRRGIRQTQSYDSNLVSEVTYTDPPEEFLIGEENLGLLAFEDAAKFFRLAAADAGSRKGLQAKCLYMAGEALRRGGQQKEAIELFDDLMAAQPDSRYVPHCLLMRGVALAESGDVTRAEAAFKKLSTEADSKGYGERWKFEGDLQLLVLNEIKDPAGTLESYQRLASQTDGKHPSVANQAKLRIGRVYIATKQYDQAEQYFRNIIDNRAASAREIVAGAYNGLGSALRNKPNASEDDYRTALYNHLRVIVSYSDIFDEQAEALYSAGKCFQRVPGKDSLARAKMMLHRCINEYPNSDWAQEAQKG